MLKIVSLCLLVAIGYAKSVAFISICHESFLDPLLSLANTYKNRNPGSNVTVYSGEFCKSRSSKAGLNFVSVGSSYLNSTHIHDLNLISSPQLPPEESNLAYTKLLLTFEEEMTRELLKQFTSSNKPDLVITNYGTYAAFNIAEVLDVPLAIFLDALYQSDLFSDEDIYSTYLPTEGFKTSGELPLSTFQRTKTLLSRLLSRYYFHSEVLSIRNSVRSNLSLPILSSTFNRAPLYLVRSFFDIDVPRALPPNYILIGNPTPLQLEKPEDEGLTEWMDESTDGFLYFSLGTIYNLSIKEYSDVLNAFFKINIKALTVQRSLHETIHKANTRGQGRVDQLAVLRHKNLKLFITNGGINSIYEAILAEVPVICIPFSADQIKTCRNLADSNSLIYIDRAELTTDILLESIKKAINTPIYKENISKKAAIIRSLDSDRRASEIVEMVLEAGYNHLVPRWYELSWCKRYNLDVYGYIFGAIFLVILAIFKTLCWILESEPVVQKPKQD